MKSKRGIEFPLSVIIIAIIVLVVMIVSIAIFSGFIGGSASDVNKNLFSISHDCDNDGINDAIDKCPSDFDVKANPATTCSTLIENCRETIQSKSCPSDKKQ